MPDNGELLVTGGGAPRWDDQHLDPSAPSPAATVLYESSVFVRRLIRLSSRCEIVCDTLPEDGIEVRCLRWTAEDRDASASFSFAADSSGFFSDDRMGTLLTGGTDGETPMLWLPRGIFVGRPDGHWRLKAADDVAVESWWELDEVPKFHLRLSATENVTVYLPMVAFVDETPVSRADLFELSGVELQRYLKSDWFDASSPADLWKYFVGSGVFDPRDSGRGRFRCQQCACAWWSYLMALHNRTGKRHYRSLARAVAWSVRVDLGPDGAWRHGFWNEKPEVHSRMLWDGVRLLLSEHELAPHHDLFAAANGAAEFAIKNLTEELDGGRLWFLHDSDEGSRPLRVPEPVLGRSRHNSLCLNTHIQALCVLAKMERMTGTGRFRDEYKRGLDALESVLGVGCGSGPLTFADRILPLLLSWKVPRGFGERVLRFLVYRVLVGGYWWARRRARCLVFPSGYIDRDLGRTMLADEYHVVNLKDLGELQHFDPHPWMEEVNAGAIRFAASLDFERALERNPIWAEWADVLEMTDVNNDVDSVQVEATVENVLGGKPLDTFCIATGVWRFEDQDR
jgi:hypothetical protein